jgi:hypothetical protein
MSSPHKTPLHHNFWMAVWVIKIALFVALAYYISCTNKEIQKGNLAMVKQCFHRVEILTYVIAVFVYLLFVYHFFKNYKDKDTQYLAFRYSRIGPVILALVLVLLASVRKMKHAIRSVEANSLPVGYLQGEFKMTESLGYITAVFAILTSAVACYTKHVDVDKLVHRLSPR